MVTVDNIEYYFTVTHGSLFCLTKPMSSFQFLVSVLSVLSHYNFPFVLPQEITLFLSA
jgi:hypothetical protein